MPYPAATIPTEVEAINSRDNKILPGKWYAQYSSFDKAWMVITVERFLKGRNYELIYSWSIYPDGRYSQALGPITRIGIDIMPATMWTPAVAAKGKYYKEARKRLADIPNQKGESTADATLDNTPVPNTELNAIRWNPPPHFITRPPSFYNLANIGEDSTLPQDVLSSYGKTATLKLGKIYQNKTSAAAINAKSPKDESKIKAEHLWGFRFLYNPKEISYGSQIDTSIDWMLQPKDPSNFFGGNTVLTFSLYLNRIVDMKALRGNEIVASDYPGGALSSEQKNGILKRGTEFDLEYLYRVVNGDPGRTSLVSDQSLETADFGYITGMPVWIQIHDNMRYRGSLSNIEVNHVLFTESMVPTLSVVKLSFIRYPELDRLGASAQDIKDLLSNKAKVTDK